MVDLPEPVGPVTRTRPWCCRGEVAQHRRQAELGHRRDLPRDHPQRDRGEPALAERVAADPGVVAPGEREVVLVLDVPGLGLRRVSSSASSASVSSRGQRRRARHRRERAVDADLGRHADGEQQVGAAGLPERVEQRVDPAADAAGGAGAWSPDPPGRRPGQAGGRAAANNGGPPLWTRLTAPCGRGRITVGGRWRRWPTPTGAVLQEAPGRRCSPVIVAWVGADLGPVRLVGGGDRLGLGLSRCGLALSERSDTEDDDAGQDAEDDDDDQELDEREAALVAAGLSGCEQTLVHNGFPPVSRWRPPVAEWRKHMRRTASRTPDP